MSLPTSPEFRAEFGEDVFLFNHFRHLFQQPGAYLDIGCGPPVSGSNTHWLRSLGWAGVGIDANPGYADQWERATDQEKTRFICAILSPKPMVEFAFFHNCPGWSRIPGEKMEKPRYFGATRLADLIRQSRMPPVDFLSIDLEGAECDVLSDTPSLFWAGSTKVIIAEHSTAQAGGGVKRDECVKHLLLSNKGDSAYELVHETVANYVFILRRLLRP